MKMNLYVTLRTGCADNPSGGKKEGERNARRARFTSQLKSKKDAGTWVVCRIGNTREKRDAPRSAHRTKEVIGRGPEP